ncbi:hypothetical protein D3C84_906580 [compost metagenome]
MAKMMNRVIKPCSAGCMKVCRYIGMALSGSASCGPKARMYRPTIGIRLSRPPRIATYTPTLCIFTFGLNARKRMAMYGSTAANRKA